MARQRHFCPEASHWRASGDELDQGEHHRFGRHDAGKAPLQSQLWYAVSRSHTLSRCRGPWCEQPLNQSVRSGTRWKHPFATGGIPTQSVGASPNSTEYARGTVELWCGQELYVCICIYIYIDFFLLVIYFIYLFMYVFIYVFIYVCIFHLFIHLFIYLFILYIYICTVYSVFRGYHLQLHLSRKLPATCTTTEPPFGPRFSQQAGNDGPRESSMAAKTRGNHGEIKDNLDNNGGF